jgi:eukaryotic-like serine/threonine-protein kinase
VVAKSITAVDSPEAYARLADDLKQEWRRGVPPDLAAAVRDHPGLLAHRTLVIDLAYEEYCLREEAGCAPDPESFCFGLPAYRSYFREVLRGHIEFANNREFQTSTEATFPEAGDLFDGLRVIGNLGHGAFARVYLVLDPRTGNRPLVLKVSRRISGEAQALGTNEHPNVVPIYSARTVDGLFAICMPFVGATTLHNVNEAFVEENKARTTKAVLNAIQRDLAAIPFPIKPQPALLRVQQPFGEAIAAIAARLAHALAQLHGNGVCHGDLKPSNVLLGPGGNPFLIDFNLASTATESSIRCGGTLPYMAPERIRLLLDSKADAGRADLADIYSFGAVLFECLTGAVPIAPIDVNDLHATAEDLLRRQATACPRIRAANGKTPRALIDLIEACLNVDPAKRPSAEQFARVLTSHAVRRTRRLRKFLALALALAVAAIAGKEIVALTSSPARPATDVHAAHLENPISSDPFERGLYHLDRGFFESAIVAFDEARLTKRDGRTYAYLAYSHSRAAQHRKAGEFYQMAIERDFAPAWVHNNRAYSLTQFAVNERPQMLVALDEVTKARALDRNNRAIQFHWAYIRYLVKQDANTKRLYDPECVATMRTVMADGPRDAEMYFKAALVLAAASAGHDELAADAVGYLHYAVELGKPIQQLRRERACQDFLSGRDDFKRLMAEPPPVRKDAPLHLELLNPRR